MFSYEILWRVRMMVPLQTTGFLLDKACRHRLGQCILLCVSMHLVSQPTRVSMHLTLKFYSPSFSGFQVMKLNHHHTKVILIFQHHIAVPPNQLKKNKQCRTGDNFFHHRMGRPSWKEALTSVNASSILTRDIVIMITSSHGNTFRITDSLWVESRSHLFPLPGASNAEIWCFLCWSPERYVEQTIELLVIWDAITLSWCYYNGGNTYY